MRVERAIRREIVHRLADLFGAVAFTRVMSCRFASMSAADSNAGCVAASGEAVGEGVQLGSVRLDLRKECQPGSREKIGGLRAIRWG
ncbi:MAG: hypothetical protein B9S34_09600 [Opitutia bacterium Tous-C1TDCM]|nr:MAG: hypothetical protein B9S34_09600 [Opitutae bacterium Tous-C1TDCM]